MKKVLLASVAAIALGTIHAPAVLAEDGAIWIPANNAKIAQTLTVINIANEDVEISWKDSFSSNDKVEYGKTQESLTLYSTTSCEKPPTQPNLHCRLLKGLNPNTKYFYKIPTAGEANEDIYQVGGSFVTISGTSSGTSMSISTVTVDRPPSINITVTSTAKARAEKLATTSLNATTSVTVPIKLHILSRVCNFITSILNWFN